MWSQSDSQLLTTWGNSMSNPLGKIVSEVGKAHNRQKQTCPLQPPIAVCLLQFTARKRIKISFQLARHSPDPMFDDQIYISMHFLIMSCNGWLYQTSFLQVNEAIYLELECYVCACVLSIMLSYDASFIFSFPL